MDGFGRFLVLFITVSFASPHLTALAKDGDTEQSSEQSSEKKEGDLSEQELDDLKKLDSETILVKAPRLPSEDASTSMAQVIDVADSTSRLQTVTEVVGDAVGVQVRTLGGLGAYGSASIRGSNPNQVPVYLDGILLNAGGFDTVDLGSLSLDLFEQINIYRSGAPTSLGTVGIGGAIQFDTRISEKSLWEGVLSAGSNSTYRLMALGNSSLSKKNKLLALLSLSSSAGDFLYFDDNGTRFNTADDTVRSRQNNSHKALTAMLKMDTQAWGWGFRILGNLYMKTQGVPGMQNTITKYASLDTSRVAIALQSNHVSEKGWRLRPELNYLYLAEEMNDSHGAHGELGMGRQHATTTTHAVSGGLLFQIEPAQGHFTSLRADARWERLDQHDLLSDTKTGTRQRITGGLSAQHQWIIARKFSILPSGRIELLQSSFDAGTTPGSIGVQEQKHRTEALWHLGLGGRFDILENLSIVANAGRYVRPPSLGELFGYRGTVVGNPELESETGFKTDIGLQLSSKTLGPMRHFRLETAGFATWTQNLISYWQNSQNTVKAQNIDAARVMGVEFNVSAELWRLLRLSGNYTFMDTKNRSETPFYRDKALPGRPAHELYAKAELFCDTAQWSASLWTDVSYTAGNYLDPSNMKDAGARAIMGLGLKFANERYGLSLVVEVKNLLNTNSVTTADGFERALEDYEGFPLPGRTIMTTVRWKSADRS